jgi:hypothetical protein
MSSDADTDGDAPRHSVSELESLMDGERASFLDEHEILRPTTPSRASTLDLGGRALEREGGA